jgi:hypothetical protein
MRKRTIATVLVVLPIFASAVLRSTEAQACSTTDICIDDGNTSTITYTGSSSQIGVLTVASTGTATGGTMIVAGSTTSGFAGTGVYGVAEASGGLGILGSGGTSANGVMGEANSTNNATGVAGVSVSGNGGYTVPAHAFGVFGYSDTYDAIHGLTDSTNAGVSGNNTSTGYGVYAYSASGTSLYVNGNGEYTGTWTHSSDERMKKNIATLQNPVDQLLRLRGVSFEWRDPAKHGNASGIQRGFIAQEYEKVFPEWVTTDKEGYKAIDTTGLDALEVEGIRDLKARNDALTAEIDMLKKRMAAIEDGRRPVIAGLGNGFSLGVAGIAIAGALFMSRRKRPEEDSKS